MFWIIFRDKLGIIAEHCHDLFPSEHRERKVPSGQTFLGEKPCMFLYSDVGRCRRSQYPKLQSWLKLLRLRNFSLDLYRSELPVAIGVAELALYPVIALPLLRPAEDVDAILPLAGPPVLLRKRVVPHALEQGVAYVLENLPVLWRGNLL
jgi:hypothetical protein